jgi:hypothetical protein
MRTLPTSRRLAGVSSVGVIAGVVAAIVLVIVVIWVWQPGAAPSPSTPQAPAQEDQQAPAEEDAQEDAQEDPAAEADAASDEAAGASPADSEAQEASDGADEGDVEPEERFDATLPEFPDAELQADVRNREADVGSATDELGSEAARAIRELETTLVGLEAARNEGTDESTRPTLGEPRDDSERRAERRSRTLGVPSLDAEPATPDLRTRPDAVDANVAVEAGQSRGERTSTHEARVRTAEEVSLAAAPAPAVNSSDDGARLNAPAEDATESDPTSRASLDADPDRDGASTARSVVVRTPSVRDVREAAGANRMRTFAD